MEKITRFHFTGIVSGVLSLFVLMVLCPVGQAYAKQFNWPKAMQIGGAAVGTSSYALLTSWTPVMEQSTGMKIRILPGGQSERFRFLKKQRIALNMETSPEAVIAMEGRGAHAIRDGGPFQMRVVWLGQKMPFGFFVRGDSEIKTIYDIKPGTKISYFTPAKAAVAACDALLSWINVDKEKIIVVPIASFPNQVKSVMEGKADVAYAPTTPSVVFEVESGPHGMRWLPLEPQKDPEGAKRFLEFRPTAVWGQSNLGVQSSRGVPMFFSTMPLFSHKDMDIDLAYNMAKWLHQNFDAYKDKHPVCKVMSIDSFREALDYSFLPVHEGTIKYLREIGKWSKEDDKRQNYNVNLLSKYANAYEKGIAEADTKKIKIDPKNKKWIELWTNYKEGIPRIQLMMDIQ